ncbi:MAG: ferredoxin [Eubacteriales Family XIII. Incertae Sedis bacterium]|nr:MAG: ferredoxin [Clostridiales Family XIII bacterium]
MTRSKVYFTKEITPESVVKIYEALSVKLPGKTAVKLHSGEEGNQNYIRPEFVKAMVNKVNGTVVECNTAYDGQRNTTEKHLRLLENHGWSKYFDVDLLDAEGPDLELCIPDGLRLKKNYVGKNLVKYDSVLVLSHFKGHPMGGFGGALKQLSIGFASSHGKHVIHGVGDATADMFGVKQEEFLESMADAAMSVHKRFEGKIAYINIMCNLSVDCDCVAQAQDPCMKDIGIAAGLDPVAVDQACIDMVYASDDPGKEHLIERIESRKGVHTIEAAAALGFGTRDYELVSID